MIYKVEPVFKDYIWGGEKLKDIYGKKSSLDIVAESWELSTHSAGVCQINTEEGTKALDAYIKEKGVSVVGTKAQKAELPILIKLIDARDNLSVQVHPDDAYAMEFENDLGKTEMWYILEAEEGAQLVYGFKDDMTKETFKESIENDTLCDHLNYVDVHKGDVFFITPGTMHAIGKGILIAEIQESSNVTYRVYDYGRKDKEGNPRELHVEKALEVTKLEKAGEGTHPYEMKEVSGGQMGTLVSCEYFNVKRLDVKEQIALNVDETSFHHILVVEGTLEIKQGEEAITATKGESFFIPAGSGEYVLKGKGEVILSTL